MCVSLRKYEFVAEISKSQWWKVNNPCGMDHESTENP